DRFEASILNQWWRFHLFVTNRRSAGEIAPVSYDVGARMHTSLEEYRPQRPTRLAVLAIFVGLCLIAACRQKDSSSQPQRAAEAFVGTESPEKAPISISGQPPKSFNDRLRNILAQGQWPQPVADTLTAWSDQYDLTNKI